MKKTLIQVLILLFFGVLLEARAATYVEAGGVVVVEAEHFDVRTSNTDGHHWAVMPDENGNPDSAADSGFLNARGNKYVQSLPDSAGGGSAYNTTDKVGIDPHLDIKVQISNPGRYHLYIRWAGYDGSSDSLFGQIVELMSPKGPGPDWYRFVGNNPDFDARGWDGAGAPSTDTANNVSAGGGEVPAVWDITTPGTYTIRLGMREDGSAVDTVILQLESLPAPSGRGPAESSTAGGTDKTPPTVVSAVTAGNPSGVLVVFSEAVAAATATNKANYTVDNGVTVNSVSPGQNNFSVVVNTTPIAPGKTYNITISGVQDTAGNSVAANTKVQFYQVDGVIERRVFLNVSGNTVANLTGAASFTGNTPDVVTYPTSFEGPTTYADNYGTQFRGYVTAPVSGAYVFYICSDDNSALYLSTDDNPANKKLIAAETVWSDSRKWVSSGGSSDLAQKRSDQNPNTEWPGTVINLAAGKRYYIEMLHKEGGGGDNTGVTWQLPGAPEPADGDPPIPGQYLSAFGIAAGVVTVTTQPTDVTVNELLPAKFSVVPAGSPPYTFQWNRNGTAIAGATGSSYTIARTALEDNGVKFTAQVSNPFSTVTSSAATLTVIVDKTPPVLLGAKANPNLTEVVLTFSERVAQASATAAASYKITSSSGTLNVTAAALSSDATKVTLTTAQQTLGTKYTVTVNNVTDQAGTPNPIAANSKTGFFPVGKIAQGANGLIVFEAENYDRNLDNLWIKNTTRGTPSGGASMVVPSGGSETATQLEFDVVFKTAGTYIIWYRASGDNGGSDSSWFHIDGDRDPNRVDGNQSSMTGFSGQQDFVWLSAPQDGGGQMTFDVATPGSHVIGVARRENNAYFDKFIITSDPSYVPTGQGPAETREGLPAPPTVTLTSPTEGQKFATGATINLTVNTSGATGIDMARVEYSANGVVIGQATQSPFTFAWSNAKDGSYTIAAKAIDEVGGSTTSAGVNIKVGTPPPLVYFVTADPGPLTYAGDIAIYQRLLKRGFDVRLARGADVPADGSSANGTDLIIQSSSLGSTTVEDANFVGKFRTLAIPAIVWEASSQDAFAFQAANGTTTADQTQINIVDSASPLAAGFPKGLLTTSTAEPYSQGTPEGAHIVATLAGDPSQAVIYNYDKGEKGANGFVMPARRVFFFFGDNTAAVATADGLKLFDAAVDWALGGKVIIPPKASQFTKIAKNADGTITVEWTGGGTLQASPAVTGPWQDVTGASSPYKFTPTGAALFGRIKN